MPPAKFQDNISLIDKNTSSFSEFVSQIKPLAFSPRRTQNNGQEKSQISPCSFRKSAYEKEYQLNPENITQQNNFSKHRYFQQQRSNGNNLIESKSQIRNRQKLKISRSLHLRQKNNMEREHSKELIFLKSVSQIPSWLFEHVKKQNANKLKNICVKSVKQIDTNEINQNSSKKQLNNNSQFSHLNTQRAFNKNYLLRYHPHQTADKSHKYEQNHQKVNLFNLRLNRINHFGGQNEDINQKRVKNGWDLFINDYEYSYCGDVQKEEAKNISKQTKRLDFWQERAHKEKYQCLKSRSNQHRITQYKNSISGSNQAGQRTSQRLQTVSEQKPLIEPRRFLRSQEPRQMSHKC